MFSKKEKTMLRHYWMRDGTYHAIKITASGEVHAKQRRDSSWGVLETAEQAKRSAAELIRKEYEYLRWKTFHKLSGKCVRKRGKGQNI